jgi:hypothetical protein
MFLVVFATPTPYPLCLTKSRPGLVLVFFLVIHLVIRAIVAWTLPLSQGSQSQDSESNRFSFGRIKS